MYENQICHIYHKQSVSKHTDVLLRELGGISVNIDEIDKLPEAALYVIEFLDIPKSISKKLQDFFKKKQSTIIYFDVPKNHTLMHVQLAVALKSKFILTPAQDTLKVIKKIKRDLIIYKKENSAKEISDYFGSNQLYFVVENKKITYASDKLLLEFGCSETSFDDVYKKVFKQLDLKSDEQKIKNKKYLLEKKKLSDKFFFILSEIINQPSTEINMLSTRIKFMEVLKNKILHKGAKDNKLSLVTISIRKLSDEGFLKDIIKEMQESLERRFDLYLYNKNYYIALYDDMHIDKVINYSKQLNIELCTLKNTKGMDTFIQIYCLNLEYLELSQILNKLHNISQIILDDEILSDGTTTLISDGKDSLDDTMIMQNIIDVISVNKSKFKLFNIYKGLVVNHFVWLIKHTDDSITLQLDKIQAKVISIQQKSIINIPLFSQTIEITLADIDHRTNIATFNNLTISKHNVCQREHGRVETSSQTKVELSTSGITMQGDILDISIKSVAIIVPYNNIVESLQDRDIHLSFELSIVNEKFHHKIKQKAKVINIFDNEEGKSAKIVCDLISNIDNEEILTKYVYYRQKCIIKELSNTEV